MCSAYVSYMLMLPLSDVATSSYGPNVTSCEQRYVYMAALLLFAFRLQTDFFKIASHNKVSRG